MLLEAFFSPLLDNIEIWIFSAVFDTHVVFLSQKSFSSKI